MPPLAMHLIQWLPICGSRSLWGQIYDPYIIYSNVRINTYAYYTYITIKYDLEAFKMSVSSKQTIVFRQMKLFCLLHKLYKLAQ